MRTKTYFALSSAVGAMTAAEQRVGRYMRAPEHLDGDTSTPEPDAFGDAFAAAAAEGTPPVDPVTPPAADSAPAADPVTPPAADPVTPPADPATPPPADPAPPADPVTPPAADPAPSPQDIVQQLTDALKNQPAAPAAPAAPAVEVEQPPLYSDQEMAVLADYEKNWPDVAQAELLKRRAEYADLMTFMFKSVRDWMTPHLDQLSALGNMAHEQQLRTAVPDYSVNLETEVANWIETQPTYLRGGMKQVMQAGTSEEVADLIGRYKSATGAQAAPATPAAQPGVPAPQAPTPARQTELSSAAKQAAESLAPVSGDRSAVPQGEDPLDFDNAFQKFAATGAV